MALKCKLGLHSYVPVHMTKKTTYSLFQKAMLDVMPDSNSEAYRYVYDDLNKKITNTNSVIRNNICLGCGKIRYDVDIEYNKLHKKISKKLKEFEGIMKMKKAADKLYTEGCSCKKGCDCEEEKE